MKQFSPYATKLIIPAKLRQHTIRFMKYRLAFYTAFVLVNVEICHAQWIPINDPFGSTITCMAVDGSNLFAGTDGEGVLLSSDNGVNWTSSSAGLPDYPIAALAANGSNLFAGTAGDGVYLSSNYGASWIAVSDGLTNLSINTLAVNDPLLFAGTGGGVFLSTNTGTSWIAVNDGIINPWIASLVVSGENIFAGTKSGVFLSTNNGTRWTSVNAGLTNLAIKTVVVIGADIFAVTDFDGLFELSGNDTSWTRIDVGIPGHYIYSVTGYDSTLITGALFGGVFLSTNKGKTWSPFNSGLPDYWPILNLATSATHVFAQSEGGLWRRPLSEVQTGVDEIQNQAPSQFTLEQNYPNPFNPTTIITYSVAHATHVTLKVYNPLGQELATLIDHIMPAGTHTVNWHAQNFPSGVYFYRITVDDHSKLNKMMLVR